MATGSIDEIIGSEAIKGVDVTIQKLERLEAVFISLTKNVGSLNTSLESGSIAKKTSEITKLTTDTEKLKTVTQQTINIQKEVNEEYRKTGDALNELDRANAKVSQSTGFQNKAAKLLKEEQKEQTVVIQRTTDQWKLLEAQYKKVTLEARNMGAAHGVMSKEFKTASANANVVRAEMDAINKVLGHSQANVGNYASGLTKIWSGLRMIAYVVPGLGIAGIFSLAGDAIMEAAKGLDLFNSKWDRLNTLLGSDSVTQAKKDMSELYISVNLLHEGLISKEKFLEQYNATLGKTAGYTQDVNKAEKSILENAEAYIEMVILKADAEELLSTAIEKSAKARKFQRDEDSFFSTLKAQAIKGFNDFKKTGNFGLLFMADPTEARAEYQIAANLEAKIAQDAWVEARTKLAQQIKNNNFSDIDSVAPKSGKKTTSEKDKPTIKIRVQFDADEMIKTGIDPKLVKALGEAYQAMYAEIEKDIAGEYPPELGDVEAQQQNYILLNRKTLAEIRREKKEHDAKMIKLAEDVIALANSIGAAAQDLSEVVAARELMHLEQKNKALKEYYDNELRFIEQSGMSTEKKEKARQKLDAETEAKQKQIDRDRITALRKQASIEKAIKITEIIVNTALAVVKALPNYPLAIAAGITGAAALAKAIATPLPQYARGRKGGKAEFAETNEQGAELHITKDGKAYIPNEGKRGITYLDEGTSVLPADITKQIMSASYITLAQATQGKTEALQLALLEKTDKEIIELIGLRKDLRAKEMSATFNNYTGFEAWKNIHIR